MGVVAIDSLCSHMDNFINAVLQVRYNKDAAAHAERIHQQFFELPVKPLGDTANGGDGDNSPSANNF